MRIVSRSPPPSQAARSSAPPRLHGGTSTRALDAINTILEDLGAETIIESPDDLRRRIVEVRPACA